MNDLKERVREIIKTETEKIDERTGMPHFSILNESSTDTILQILSNYEKDLERDFDNLPKKADLIFIAAPTGAGKDSLVTRIKTQQPNKKYIELNMDMFRHYLKFVPDVSKLNDKTFAKQTNEFAYEIYYTIQEILLTEFPGTNIIITGTLRAKEWVEETFKKYKENENTDYTINLAALAVSKKDSQFSILKRYVEVVDCGVLGIDENGELIYNQDEKKRLIPGTARYTSYEYHNETFDKYPENMRYFLQKLQNGEGLIDSASVYTRSVKPHDFTEDTLVMYCKQSVNTVDAVLGAIEGFRNSKSQITQEDINDLFEIVKQKKNVQYFKEQKTLRRLLEDMSLIFQQPEFIQKIDEFLDEENVADEYIPEN